MASSKTTFTKNLEEKEITVARTFKAKLSDLWDAWTNPAILDEWWAPKPYRVITKEMIFKEGGHWLYRMEGPEGDTSWCKEEFKKIDFQQFYTDHICFCDANGNENKNFPAMFWKNEFSASEAEATIANTITFDSKKDMEAILEMGFESGYKMCLENLEAYFDSIY